MAICTEFLNIVYPITARLSVEGVQLIWMLETENGVAVMFIGTDGAVVSKAGAVTVIVVEAVVLPWLFVAVRV